MRQLISILWVILLSLAIRAESFETSNEKIFFVFARQIMLYLDANVSIVSSIIIFFLSNSRNHIIITIFLIRCSKSFFYKKKKKKKNENEFVSLLSYLFLQSENARWNVNFQLVSNLRVWNVRKNYYKYLRFNSDN